MADLTSIEKLKLEKFLGMASGYVLDFSNRAFHEFVLDTVGVDIYDARYDYASGSKANRLRGFWGKEPNFRVGILLAGLLEYFRTSRQLNRQGSAEPEDQLLHECSKIAERLQQDLPVDQTEAIRAYSPDRAFSVLAQSIRESIRKDEPELALDRLHTFTVKYIRHLCDRHLIKYDRTIPLHGLFGMYVKHLKSQGLIASEMTGRILKASISILESFNEVRNEQSFAHDNPLLSHEEASLIFNNIAASIAFLESTEKDVFGLTDQGDPIKKDDEIPF